jgi:transcriptional regulator with XRE-family HTH domain
MKKKEGESDYYYFVGRTLAKYRKRSGSNQEEAAEKLKISPSELSRIENGKREIPEDLLFKICGIYGVPVVDVTSEAFDGFKAYLLEKGPKEEKQVELPTHPVALQLINAFDAYTQSRKEREREVVVMFLRLLEALKTSR